MFTPQQIRAQFLRRPFAVVCAAVLSLAACGGGDKTGPNDGNIPTPPPPQLGPASIELVDTPTVKPADNIYVDVTLHLRNTGGPGVYSIEFWSWGSGPNAEDVLSGRTEGVEVAANYDEAATWQVYSPLFDPPLKYVIVYTRDQGSAAYRETDRYKFPF